MINGWIIPLILAYIFIQPCNSKLPSTNGVPQPLFTIEHFLESGKTHDDIKKSVERHIWKYGIDELKQYCHSITPQQGHRSDKCKKVDDIYRADYEDAAFNYQIQRNNFPTSRLNGYLEKIGQNIGNEEYCKEELKKAIHEMGWNEMKNFCDDDDNIWKHKSACTQIVNGITVQSSDWNPQSG